MARYRGLIEWLAVAHFVTNRKMVAVQLRLRPAFRREQRMIYRASRGNRPGHHKFQKLPARFHHAVSPSIDAGTSGARASSACCKRVLRRYHNKIMAMEKTRISVEMALISGVIPRRKRDQISSGSVLARPIKKKLTAISSSDKVKMRRPAATNETRRFGRVIRQKVL